MKKPINPKEQGLVKGALRRVFSRSELRQLALTAVAIKHTDPNRPRVTKWGFCEECGEITPNYLLQVDHREPVIPLDKSLADMSLDELADRIWCDLENLQVLDKECHKAKSKAENKERREFKKARKQGELK